MKKLNKYEVTTISGKRHEVFAASPKEAANTVKDPAWGLLKDGDSILNMFRVCKVRRFWCHWN